MLNRKILVLVLMATISISMSVMAQKPRNGGNTAFPASGQSKEKNSPAVAELGSMESLKAKLNASEEEWKVIEQKLRKVISARQAVDTGINNGFSGNPFGMPGGFGGPPNRGGGGGRGGPGPGFGNDSFNGPSDGPGGFGPPPGGFGPGGPGGFGPPENRNTGDATAPQRDTSKDANSDGKKPANNQPPGGPPGFGGGPPGFGGAKDSAISQAMTDLQKAASNAKISSKQLASKVAAVRTARQKAKAKLEAARKELLELINPEQEAVMVSLGYLE